MRTFLKSMAELLTNDGSSGVIRITADLNIDELKSDIIYVKAILDYGDNESNRRTIVLPGVPIVIDVNPAVK